MDLLVVRHHDKDDLGALPDIADRGADVYAVAFGALLRLRADVVAMDLEAVADHVPAHLQAHGAEPDDAGTLHVVLCHLNLMVSLRPRPSLNRLRGRPTRPLPSPTRGRG